ncbi:MAG: class 1 fructose-bisphosphatase, partial [Methylophilaceae bacterium]
EIADCTRKIANLVAKGALADITDKLSNMNVQGETQIKLDVLSNEIFVESFENSALVAGLVSEELEVAYQFSNRANKHQFLISYDPLDGSSNVAVNGTIGSIFSIMNAAKQRLPQPADYLQLGTAQVAAGYALYGPATMLVLTLGQGTQGFTLDAKTQEYWLTHANIQIPPLASEFAINSSNERFWEPPVQRYIAECKAGSAGVRGRDFNMRWLASMVADVHRILMRGGVYLYPKDAKLPAKAGRLRLLYEVNPMSFIVEQAGGKSSTGRQRLLELLPVEIHQRVPVIMGSAPEVDLIELYHQTFDAGQ